MRNLIMFLTLFTACFSAVSCSDSTEDAPVPAGSTVSLTVNGVQKTFTSVAVAQSLYTFEELSVPTYSVLASDDDTGEYIALQIEQDYTGPDGLYEFIYNDADGDHSLSIADDFTFNINTNTTSQVTGTFSGPLYQLETEPTRTITNGSFTLNINF